MDTNNIVQTVVAIVQAYASIFAIAGAFFIFVIERTRLEYDNIETRVDDSIRKIRRMVHTWSPELDEHFNYTSIKEKGLDVLFVQLEEMDFSSEFISKILSSEGYLVLEVELPKYIRLKKRTGIWAFKLFSNIFILCAVILAGSIFFLYHISFTEMNNFEWIFYHVVVISSIFGVGIFMLICWNLAKMYGRKENN